MECFITSVVCPTLQYLHFNYIRGVYISCNTCFHKSWETPIHCHCSLPIMKEIYPQLLYMAKHICFRDEYCNWKKSSSARTWRPKIIIHITLPQLTNSCYHLLYWPALKEQEKKNDTHKVVSSLHFSPPRSQPAHSIAGFLPFRTFMHKNWKQRTCSCTHWS